MRHQPADLAVESLLWERRDGGYCLVQGRPSTTLREGNCTSPPVDDFDPAQLFIAFRTDAKATPLDLESAAAESGLFLGFSEAEPLEFGNRFGLLGGVGLYEIDPATEQQMEEGEWIGEPLRAWEAEISSMADAVRLWAPEVFQQDPEVTIPRSADKAGSPHRHNEQLTSLINEHLKSDCGIQLWRDGTIALRPRTLLSALWIQFAVAIQSDKRYRKCNGCQRWFELPSHGSRYEKQFCTKACKQRTYRNRQSQARLWFLAGASLKEIAEIVNSDRATVEQWVSRRPFTKAEMRSGEVFKDIRLRSK